MNVKPMIIKGEEGLTVVIEVTVGVCDGSCDEADCKTVGDCVSDGRYVGKPLDKGEDTTDPEEREGKT